MGLNDLKQIDLNTLIGCKLTAQEAFVFLTSLNNILDGSPPQDSSEVLSARNSFAIEILNYINRPPLQVNR